MSIVSRPPPLTITSIAAEHGLHRTEVAAILTMHGVPTTRVGMARVVELEDRPRLQKLVRRYLKAKAKAS
jgi:hypothetical protein